jgi:sugar phosphate isomerase/epimerase
MARPVTLFTGQWADLPLETLAAKAAEWGFDGLELACWGDHFEVERAVAETGYAASRRELLERRDLGCFAVGISSGRPSAIRSTSGTGPSSRPTSGATASPRASAGAPPSG